MAGPTLICSVAASLLLPDRAACTKDDAEPPILHYRFDFERSALRHFLRLSRLTLAVCLRYVWFLAFGTQLV